MRYHIELEKDEYGDERWSIWPDQEHFTLAEEPLQPHDPEDNALIMMTIDANSMIEAIGIAEPKIRAFARELKDKGADGGTEGD